MKIFIIDNDELNVFLTKNMLLLEDAGLDITTFHNASEALHVLQTNTESAIPNLIFLDLDMPYMDGWEFLDALLELDSSFSENCKIYILTSSLDTTIGENIKRYPMVGGLIEKPAKMEEVRIILSQSKTSHN